MSLHTTSQVSPRSNDELHAIVCRDPASVEGQMARAEIIHNVVNDLTNRKVQEADEEALGEVFINLVNWLAKGASLERGITGLDQQVNRWLFRRKRDLYRREARHTDRTAVELNAVPQGEDDEGPDDDKSPHWKDAAQHTPEEFLVATQTEEALLSNLSPRQQAVYDLHMNGLPNNMIAQLLGISAGRASQLMAEVRKKLAQILQQPLL